MFNFFLGNMYPNNLFPYNTSFTACWKTLRQLEMSTKLDMILSDPKLEPVGSYRVLNNKL